MRQIGHCRIDRLKVQRARQVLYIVRGVTQGERRESKPLFDQLQDGSVVERHSLHLRVVRFATAER